MKVPVGGIVLLRENGSEHLYRAVSNDSRPGELFITGVGSEPLLRGQIIYRATRGLEVRGVYELKEDAALERISPPLVDTIEAEFLSSKSIMAAFSSMVASLADDVNDDDGLAHLMPTGIVVDGHSVMLSPGSASVASLGSSWSWITKERGANGLYGSIGPTAKQLSTWTFEELRAYARDVVLVEYHKQIQAMAEIGFVRCTTCHPIYQNVIKPGTLKKVG